MTVYTDEIFGPVLCVVRAGTYAEAVDLVNRNPYGNGTAIFTRDGGAARQFQFDAQAGMVGVNVPIPVPVAYYSFGGWKGSLFGGPYLSGAGGQHFSGPRAGISPRRPSQTRAPSVCRAPGSSARAAPAGAGYRRPPPGAARSPP